VSEVIEDYLSNASNKADQTTVNRHTNRMLVQLALQLALFKVSVQTQSLTYNVCNHHSVCIQCLLLLLSNFFTERLHQKNS